jgi:cytochrome c oxidase subunit 2
MAAGADTRASYQHLVTLYVPVAVAVFVLVAIALAIVAVRFRAGPSRTEASARTRAPRIEIAYVVALLVIATLLLWRSFAEMSPASTPDATHGAAVASGGPSALTVAIVASRWNWRVLYPGGVVQTGDGHGHVATLVVPANQTVRFRLTSSDVVHALWIPALRVKYDAMPRYVNTFALRFIPGLDYSTVRCSEFCGVLHDEMRMRVDVRSPAAFEKWLRMRTNVLHAR